MIKVLVVDDHPLLRTGVTTCLSSVEDFSTVGESDNAADALWLVRQARPDVVLLDIRLKGSMNGIDLAREIRRESPTTKIVMLTNYTYEPYVRAAMEVGVEGYIIKDTPPSEVIEAMRMVVSGRTVFSERIKEKIVAGYLSSPLAASRQAPESLTHREQEVLRLLAEGTSNSEIAEHLALSVKAIQAHLTNIYGKMGVQSRAEAIVQAARRGLVILDTDTPGT